MNDQRRLDRRRAPQQARSKETCDVILAATRSLLAQVSVEDLTTSTIAAKAGVSVGSLYQFFPGKEAILAHLVRELRAEMVSDLCTVCAETRHADLCSGLTALIRASLHHHKRDPALTRILEEIETALPMDAETQHLKKQMFEIVANFLIRHDVPQPEQTARDLSGMVHGMIQAALQAGEADFDALAARLDRAVLGYLRS